MRMIDLPENWENGKEFVRAGAYRVPEDMSEEDAAKAIAEAGATEIPIAEVEPDAEPKKRGGGKKALAGAPENKMLGGAEENKAGPLDAAGPSSSQQPDQALPPE